MDTIGLATNEYRSLTELAVQVDWKTPTYFHLCPIEVGPTALNIYASKLIFGEVFCETKYDQSYVVDHTLSEEQLVVITRFYDSIKDWAVTRIWMQDEKFYHKSEHTFIGLAGAVKHAMEISDQDHNIGETIDDFC